MVVCQQAANPLPKGEGTACNSIHIKILTLESVITAPALTIETAAPAARSSDPANPDWWRIARYTTLAIVFVFFASTIRQGHYWGDDFAQYLLQAVNIAQLNPSADTGYIYNPQNAIVGPRAYPSGYPAVLAPVAAVWGANLNAYKILDVFLFLVGLLAANSLFSVDLNRRDSWICLTIVGFSPVFWDAKDFIVSEHLFLPLWYAALVVADDWYRQRRIYKSETLHGFILGSLIFLTTATRSIGIVLLPVVVVCEACIARRLTRVGLSAIATSIALLGLQRALLPASGAGYLEQLRDVTAGTVLANLYSDATSFSLIWQNRHWEGVRKVAGALFAVLAAVGFLRNNVSRLSPLGIATVAYFAVIVAWPSADGLRMTLPLLSAFVFYLILGINSLPPVRFRRGEDARAGRHSGFGSRRHGHASAGSFVLLAFSLLSFGAAYSAADFGPMPTGVETGPARDLFEFVRNHTRTDEVCLFFKPRALALYTGRRASAYPLGTDEQDFQRYADSIGANILIVRDDAAELTKEDQTSEMRFPFAADSVEEIFNNSTFRVYRRTASSH